MNMHVFLRVALVVVLGVVPLLLSCGGGGGGSSAPPTPKEPGVYGIVATGLRQPNPPVVVIPGNCKPAACSSDSSGNFFCSTLGVTPPYLLRTRTTVTTQPTKTLYSISADFNPATTINITQLTDLIVRSWYKAKGLDIDTEFNSMWSTKVCPNDRPSPDTVAVIHDAIKNVVQLWLDNAGVSGDDINLIATPFDANGLGIDQVLDRAWVSANQDQLLISHGSTTQYTTLRLLLTELTTSNRVVSTVTGSILESGHDYVTSIPTDTATRDAVSGINALLSNMTATVNAKGTSLLSTHLHPYLADDAYHDGFYKADYAKNLAAGMVRAKTAGQTVNYAVKGVLSFDGLANIAEIRSSGFRDPLTFKRDAVSGKWLIQGNGRIAYIGLNTAMSTRDQVPSSNGVHVQLKIDAPVGMVSQVTISGGGIFSNTTLTTWQFVQKTEYDVNRIYHESGVLSAPPAKGTPFLVTLTTSTGLAVLYPIYSNAYTTEPIAIKNLGTVSAAVPDVPFTVKWSMPTTFPIWVMRVGFTASYGAQAYTGNGLMADPKVPSAVVTIPGTFPGGSAPIQQATMEVQITGVNGETESVRHTWP